MMKSFASLGGLLLAATFIAVFFAEHPLTDSLEVVAPRMGMSHAELLDLGPRIVASTGATLGTSRRVVYLLACSGMTNRSSIENLATEAGRLSRYQHLSDREAVSAVLTKSGRNVAGLKTC